MHAQLPNALTVARIVLAAAFPAVPGRWRLPVVAAALATEYLDGALSRRYGLESRMGRLLDPAADKLFFASVAGTFLFEGRLRLYELAALAIRDLAVATATAWLALGGRWGRLGSLKPAMAGKVTTTLQYACLLDLLLEPRLRPGLLAATAAAGCWAVARYWTEH